MFNHAIFPFQFVRAEYSKNVETLKFNAIYYNFTQISMFFTKNLHTDVIFNYHVKLEFIFVLQLFSNFFKKLHLKGFSSEKHSSLRTSLSVIMIIIFSQHLLINRKSNLDCISSSRFCLHIIIYVHIDHKGNLNFSFSAEINFFLFFILLKYC